MDRTGTKPHHTLTTDIIYLPTKVADRLGVPPTEHGKKIVTLRDADGLTIRAVRGDVVAARVATQEGRAAYTDHEFGRILGHTDAVMRMSYLRAVVHTLMIYRAQPCADCIRCRECERQMIIGYAEGYDEARAEIEAEISAAEAIATKNCGDDRECGPGNRAPTTDPLKLSPENRGSTS